MTPPRAGLSPRPGRGRTGHRLAARPDSARHSPTATTLSSSSQPSGSGEASALPMKTRRARLTRAPPHRPPGPPLVRLRPRVSRWLPQSVGQRWSYSVPNANQGPRRRPLTRHLLGADDGTRTRDPHLGKAAAGVHGVMSSGVTCGFVEAAVPHARTVRSVVERSTSGDRSKTAQTRHVLGRKPTHPGRIDDLDQGHHFQDRGRITQAG